MKKTILTYISLFLISIIYANTGKVKINGYIKNSNFDKISIQTINDRDIVSSKIGQDGKFEMKSKFESGFYF